MQDCAYLSVYKPADVIYYDDCISILLITFAASFPSFPFIFFFYSLARHNISATCHHQSFTSSRIMSHALILGASGISGWSLLNQTRVYPSPTTFKRITGTTKRPTTLEQMRLPEDDRIHLASGIDLTASVDNVVASLQKKIPDVGTVTHVFFTGKSALELSRH